MVAFRLLACTTIVLSFTTSSAAILKGNVKLGFLQQEEPHPPLIMFAHGCSGTTGAFYILRKLFKRLGFDDVAHTGGGELLRDIDAANTKDEFHEALWGDLDWHTWKNLSNASGLKEKIQIVHERTQEDHQSFLSKLQLDLAEDNPDAMRYLFRDINAKTFILRRRNVIDSLACKITDFCEKGRTADMGHNVDSDGKEVPCEFRGRMGDKDIASREESTPSVWADVDTIQDNLRRLQLENERQRQYLLQQGLSNVKMFDAEDLFAFEYDEEKVSTSAILWQEVLLSLGHLASITEVQDVLIEIGSFPPPKPHDKTFYNFDEVKDALQGSEFEDYIRR